MCPTGKYTLDKLPRSQSPSAVTPLRPSFQPLASAPLILSLWITGVKSHGAVVLCVWLLSLGKTHFQGPPRLRRESVLHTPLFLSVFFVVVVVVFNLSS